MSRHRNVKHLIDEDYYDDYDDDYYDDYDEGYSYSKPKTPQKSNKTKAKTNAKPAPAAVPRNKTPPPKSTTAASQSISVISAGSTKPLLSTGIGAAASKGNSTGNVAAGIAKPPPGWGKPSAPSSNAASSAGVVKPPPGWGKPSGGPSTPGSVGGKQQQTASPAVGVMKPPPGWGKPPSTPGEASVSSMTTTTPQKGTPSTPADGKSKQQQSRPVPQILLDKKAQRSQLSMVVIGHVDAGKSTLMGQLLYQVGHVTKRQAQKLSQASDTNTSNAASGGNNTIQWAWLLDEDEAERDHGVTMQIATKAIATANHDIIILDAPGHADFIPMMITGAANADCGLLVVDSGEFDTAFLAGQTKEHILLARGLGVTQIIVCVNKLDMQDWDKEVYENIQKQLLPFLTKQAGFVPKRVRFVPTSGLTGGNIKKDGRSTGEDDGTALLRKWYKGPTLLEAIDGFLTVKQRSIDKPLRLILTDVYADGKGVGARGRVVQGFVRQGDKIVVLPIGDAATVTSLIHLQPLPSTVPAERHSYAVAGDTVDVVLGGIDIVRVSVGCILSWPDLPSRPPIRQKFRAQILVMDQLAIPIIRGAQLLFHIHNLDIPAVLTNLISSTKRDGSKKRDRPRAVTSGSSAIVEISLGDRTCMESFADCSALGRFVLRRSGDTVAVGKIEEVL